MTAVTATRTCPTWCARPHLNETPGLPAVHEDKPITLSGLPNVVATDHGVEIRPTGVDVVLSFDEYDAQPYITVTGDARLDADTCDLLAAELVARATLIRATRRVVSA